MRFGIEDNRLVYVVQAGDFIKVGIATNIQQRMREMQVGCPMKITLLTITKAKYPRQLEKRIHSELKHCHVRGEWFQAIPALEYLRNLKF